MNEITRIHIAKTPYDIEVIAKKEIEKYIKSLTSYANDVELLNDIEIRITELLADRGVMSNGVISNDDVTAIREQLGEPEDFIGDQSEKTFTGNKNDASENLVERKLYRNVDNAVLGGVLSGIASFFRIDSVWTRLAFVILFFMSAGTLTLVYILFWIIIPPARTATEKLQMTGRPVNLASMRDLNDSGPALVARQKRAHTARRIVSIIVGIFCVSAAVTTIIFTIFTALGIGNFGSFDYFYDTSSWIYVCAYILAIAAGLLLTALFVVSAYASFSRKFTNRILASIVSIIVLGLASFGVAVGLVSYQSSYSYQTSYSDMKESNMNVPAKFENIKSIKLEAGSAKVDYIVSDVSSMKIWMRSTAKKPVVSVEGTTATLKIETDSASIEPVITIHGPKLDSISIKSGDISYSSLSQDLIVESSGNSRLNLVSGTFANLSLSLNDNTSVDASAVYVESSTINMKSNSSAVLGTIKNLSVTQSEICPVDTNTSVSVRNVTSKSITYNGSIVSAESHIIDCGSITVGNVTD